MLLGVKMKPGDLVRFDQLPPWFDRMPKESQDIIEFCMHKPYRVDSVDEQGLLVLDVSPDVDEHFGGTGNDLRFEAEHLRLVETEER